MSEETTYSFFDALEKAKTELDEHNNVNEVHLNLICAKYAPPSLQASLEAVQNDLALLAAEASPGFTVHDVIRATVVRVMRENLYLYLAEKLEAGRKTEKIRDHDNQVQISSIKGGGRGNRR